MSSSSPSPENDFVGDTLEQNQHAVTVFSLSWCGYCHAVRDLLDAQGTPVTVVDIDRPDFQKTGLVPQVRQRLRELTGQSTLPQVFVGKESVGGYRETSACVREGRWAALLEKHAVGSD